MSLRTPRLIFPLSSKEGLIYKIPVDDNPNPKYCFVEGPIWDELISMGLNPRLIFTNKHVCFFIRYTYRPLAYLIMDCTNEDRISYKDRNKFNLRQSNIMVHTTPHKIEHYRDWLRLPKYLLSMASVEYAPIQQLQNGVH